MHAPEVGNARPNSGTSMPRKWDNKILKRESKILKGVASAGRGRGLADDDPKKTKTTRLHRGQLDGVEATPDELAYWRTQRETPRPEEPPRQDRQEDTRPAPEPGAAVGRGRSPPAREAEPSRLVDVEKPGPGTPAKAPQDPASRADIVWPG